MKGAVLYEYNQPLVIEDLELDPPGRGEVKLKVAACAICHSDIHSFRGEHGSPPQGGIAAEGCRQGFAVGADGPIGNLVALTVINVNSVANPDGELFRLTLVGDREFERVYRWFDQRVDPEVAGIPRFVTRDSGKATP